MRILLGLSAAVMTSPAFAAGGKPFFSFANTDFIVTLGFIAFIGILLYFKVPAMATKALDERAAGIERDLEEARNLREEAQSLLASYERKSKEVAAQAEKIVEQAKQEAEAASAQAKLDLEASVARRLVAAEDQIASAEASAIKEVRDRAVDVAIAAAGAALTENKSKDRSEATINEAIAAIKTKLH